MDSYKFIQLKTESFQWIMDLQQLTKDDLWFIFAGDDEVYKCVPK